jgi:hypothetical protein
VELNCIDGVLLRLHCRDKQLIVGWGSGWNNVPEWF